MVWILRVLWFVFFFGGGEGIGRSVFLPNRWGVILLMEGIRRSAVEGTVVYPTIFQGFSTIPGGWEWDFWTINSMVVIVFFFELGVFAFESLHVTGGFRFVPKARFLSGRFNRMARNGGGIDSWDDAQPTHTSPWRNPSWGRVEIL